MGIGAAYYSSPPPVYIAWMGEAAGRRAAEIARSMRNIGNPIELATDDAKLKKSLETASKMGASYVLIIGDRELQETGYLLRNMKTGEQRHVDEKELYELYKHRRELRLGTLSQDILKEKME